MFYELMFQVFKVVAFVMISGWLGGAYADTNSDLEQGNTIYIDGSGKQMSSEKAWRSEGRFFECQVKTVKNNKRTGRPSMKKVD